VGGTIRRGPPWATALTAAVYPPHCEPLQTSTRVSRPRSRSPPNCTPAHRYPTGVFTPQQHSQTVVQRSTPQQHRHVALELAAANDAVCLGYGLTVVALCWSDLASDGGSRRITGTRRSPTGALPRYRGYPPGVWEHNTTAPRGDPARQDSGTIEHMFGGPRGAVVLCACRAYHNPRVHG
jgi:hypothetical protein